MTKKQEEKVSKVSKLSISFKPKNSQNYWRSFYAAKSLIGGILSQRTPRESTCKEYFFNEESETFQGTFFQGKDPVTSLNELENILGSDPNCVTNFFQFFSACGRQLSQDDSSAKIKSGHFSDESGKKHSGLSTAPLTEKDLNNLDCLISLMDKGKLYPSHPLEDEGNSGAIGSLSPDDGVNYGKEHNLAVSETTSDGKERAMILNIPRLPSNSRSP